MAACIGLLALAASSRAPADAASEYVPPKPYPVRVHLVSDHPEFGLQLAKEDGTALCELPCDRELQFKEYERFQIIPSRAGAGVALIFQEIPPLAFPPQPASVIVDIQAGHPSRRVAGAFLLGGGGTIALLGMLTGLSEAAVVASHPADPTTARNVRDVGFGAALIGLAVGIAGLTVIHFSPPPIASIRAAQ